MMSAHILAEARSWIGTPYRHQGSTKGVGCDCLGLVRGVWREVYGEESELPGPYAPDWAEAGGGDTLLEAARRHCAEKSVQEMEPGDLLVFRWRTGLPAKHCGILSAPDRFIHAYQCHAVTESALVPQWRRRVAGVFGFADVAAVKDWKNEVIQQGFGSERHSDASPVAPGRQNTVRVAGQHAGAGEN